MELNAKVALKVMGHELEECLDNGHIHAIYFQKNRDWKTEVCTDVNCGCGRFKFTPLEDWHYARQVLRQIQKMGLKVEIANNLENFGWSCHISKKITETRVSYLGVCLDADTINEAACKAIIDAVECL